MNVPINTGSIISNIVFSVEKLERKAKFAHICTVLQGVFKSQIQDEWMSYNNITIMYLVKQSCCLLRELCCWMLHLYE